jgi:LuxR family maltose regulon positive regulatory protein
VVDSESPVSGSKFITPLAAAAVVRERLFGVLNAAQQFPLNLISAGAGWGKTTLLSAWVAGRADPLAWVSLDERDNEPGRFWRALIAAIRIHRPNVGADALALLQSADPASAQVVITALTDALLALPPEPPLALVLDD